MTKLAFIGAGSTIFMKNIVGDMLHFRGRCAMQRSR